MIYVDTHKTFWSGFFVKIYEDAFVKTSAKYLKNEKTKSKNNKIQI